MGPLDIQRIYRNRIDILKRFDKKLPPSHQQDYDPDKYVQLSHGQLVKRETIKAGKLFVNGHKVVGKHGA